MNKVSRADIDVLCRPGDVVAVEYLDRDLTAKLIDFAEGSEDGEATHALCCLGGLDIVQASITGVEESNLHNYLRGNCRLTVRCARPDPTPEQAEKATDFWSARVLDPYDFGMIIGSMPVLFAKRVLGFFSKDLGEWAMKNMPNFLASGNLSTCAELGARGIRQFCPTAFTGYAAGMIDPQVLRDHPSLRTKAVLDAAVLVD